MAQELETALGGVYSILSQEFQLPLVRLLLARLESDGKMPKMPKDSIKPQIVTGLEALGQGQDLNKLAQFLTYLQPLGPQVISQNLNVDDYIDRLGASLGIDTGGLVKSVEEKAQEMQAMQQAQQQAQSQKMMQDMAVKATPQLADQMIKQQQGRQLEMVDTLNTHQEPKPESQEYIDNMVAKAEGLDNTHRGTPTVVALKI